MQGKEMEKDIVRKLASNVRHLFGKQGGEHKKSVSVSDIKNIIGENKPEARKDEGNVAKATSSYFR